MKSRVLVAIGLAIVAASVASQTAPDGPAWAEDLASQPPSYSTNRLIPIDMPPYVTIKVGIDPDTVTVGSDGVVRYVVVMRNATGSQNAAYEGILCAQGEVKTYARTRATGAWTAVDQPQWRPMTDNLGSRHAFAIAQQGGCEGRATGKREDVIQALQRRQKGNY